MLFASRNNERNNFGREFKRDLNQSLKEGGMKKDVDYFTSSRLTCTFFLAITVLIMNAVMVQAWA